MYFYFSQETGFDISCKLSPLETICMKCQILFSGENNKNIISLRSAEFAHSMVSVNIKTVIISHCRSKITVSLFLTKQLMS